MKRARVPVTVSLPSNLAENFERLAKAEAKNKSQLFREMLTVYERRRWEAQFHELQRYGVKKAHKKGALTESNVENWCFKAAEMRVVFDTNIYISAFAVPRGNAEEAYLKAIHGEFELFPSVAILTEAARVLQ